MPRGTCRLGQQRRACALRQTAWIVACALTQGCAGEQQSLAYVMTSSAAGSSTALVAHRVDPESGSLAALQTTTAFDGPLAVHPSGQYLFLGRDSKPYGVRAFRIASDGTLEDLGSTRSAYGGRAVRMHASAGALHVQTDDSSTGYSAGIDAFRFDAGTGQIAFLDTFASRSGGYGTGTPTLWSTELHPSGRFLYELSGTREGGRMTTHRIEGDGRLVQVGESSVPSLAYLEAIAHPSDRFLYVLAAGSSTGGSLHTYAIDSATGLPQLTQTVEVTGSFRPRTREPRLGTSHPSGRALYLSASDTVVSVAIETTTGAVGSVTHRPKSRGEGVPAVDPLGRFLYLSGAGGNRVWLYRIEDDFSLSEVGPVSAGGGDLRLVSLRSGRAAGTPPRPPA